MAYAVGIYSTMVISDDDLTELMQRLGATPTKYGWSLSRNESTIEIDPVHDEIPDDVPDDKLKTISRELGGPPRSKLVVIWLDDHDGFEARMARAVARALSETFPVVLDDNFGTVEAMRPASSSD